MARILLSAHHTTIHYKDTMLVMNREGWVTGERDGLFSRDTRYISNYQITLNGFDPVFLGASRPYYFAATFHYTNPRIGNDPHAIPSNSLLLKVSRLIQDGMHEDLELTNYSGKRVEIHIAVHFGTDFTDIFQVRGLEGLVAGIARTEWDPGGDTMVMRYRKGDFKRSLVLKISRCANTPIHSFRAITFRVKLSPGETWTACLDAYFDERLASQHAEEETLEQTAQELRRWEHAAAALVTPVTSVAQTYRQAVSDLGSLRLEEYDESWFPAAGMPWYMAVFGRDGLITALQTLTVHCPFGIGVLERLAELQGKKVDLWTEEQPGRIPHELRHGELAATGKIPHTPYYGTADAPLLYVILLHDLYSFSADHAILERFYHNAAACLEWAARYGDIDGDGFVEYRPFSPKGYRNQGWKDAYDAVVYPDGTLVEPPIAICEIQGYYYDALCRMAEIAELCKRPEEAAAYARRARELFTRFNDVFWCEGAGTYAFALDPEKRRVESIASNPGHLLWSRIVPIERAERVVHRLMDSDMFSGWGVRTLSAANPAYDPISYQRGSVWPHDNAIIALGFKRYGFWQEANRIAEGIFALAANYEEYTLPELFAGVDRQSGMAPVPYPEANVPQAWAAGSVFMLLRAILGLEPDPSQKRLIVSPTLPEWLPELALRGLTIFGNKVDIRFSGAGLESSVELSKEKGAVQLEHQRGDSLSPSFPHFTINRQKDRPK